MEVVGVLGIYDEAIREQKSNSQDNVFTIMVIVHLELKGQARS